MSRTDTVSDRTDIVLARTSIISGHAIGAIEIHPRVSTVT